MYYFFKIGTLLLSWGDDVADFLLREPLEGFAYFSEDYPVLYEALPDFAKSLLDFLADAPLAFIILGYGLTFFLFLKLVAFFIKLFI